MKLFLVLFIAAISLSACEGVSDVIIQPYQEKIVIHGFLSAGDTVRNIEIVRLRDFSGDTTIAIPDARVVINDGMRDYQLTLQPIHQSRLSLLAGRTFYQAPGLIAKAGQTYKLTVGWRDKKAEATTRVPEPLLPDSVSFAPSPDNNFLVVKAWLRPRSKEAYILYQTHRLKPPMKDSLRLEVEEVGPSEIIQQQQSDGNTPQLLSSFLLTLGETARFREIYTRHEQFSSTAVLHAFDSAIWDYVTMRNNRRSGASDSFISQSSSAIRGNVKGDGIGLFIGVATSRTPFKKK